MKTKLKPCPFCGGTRVCLVEGWSSKAPHKNWRGCCKSCDSMGEEKGTKVAARKVWNRRASKMKISDKNVDKIRELLGKLKLRERADDIWAFQKEGKLDYDQRESIKRFSSLLHDADRIFDQILALLPKPCEPLIIYLAANKVSSQYFEDREDAERYAGSAGASAGIQVIDVLVLPSNCTAEREGK